MNDTPNEREAESTWTRLRRRKVVQWGLVYVAAAWGFLQGLEYLSGTYDWPRQIQQLATLALLIGLPVVLVIGWYHGDRGQQRITTPEFAILTLLLLLGGGVFWYYQRASQAGSEPAPAANTAQRNASPGVSDARPSVAVLPFENRSREADDAFFVDGIHDDILTQLSKVSALKVISRTSVEQFRDAKLPMKAIAGQLGVTNILEGGVQRAGNRVRITVQLIDAATDAHLWAENYDRELSAANIFAIQSELAAAIAGALKTTLTPEEQARAKIVPTQILEAWEAYQLGQQRMARRTSESLADAEQFFRSATELDPTFALAHVALADVLRLQIEYSGTSKGSALAQAEKSVTEALKLDPDLAEAWASAGGMAWEESQYDRAELMFKRAIELNPSYAPARHWYALLLADQFGRPDEALPQIERAAELDPLSAMIRIVLGGILEQLGRFRDAEAAYLKAISIDPSNPSSYLSLGTLRSYVFNRFAEALPLVRRAEELDPDSPAPVFFLTICDLNLGDDNIAFERSTQAVRRWPTNSYAQGQMALSYLFQGDAAGAARHAQRAIDVYPRIAILLAMLRNLDLQENRLDAALMRYRKAYPELFTQGSPRVDRSNYEVAIDVAQVLKERAEVERANLLLDEATRTIESIPRLGYSGHRIADVQVHALRGETAKALAALRRAQRDGWRLWWRYYRDFDPSLASIRDAPEFKAVFGDIERDMARQRAELAARPKDAPLELTDVSK